MNNYFISKKILFYLALGVIFSGAVFSSFYRLTESPPTWTDEGLIIQTSQNLSGQGKYGFQISPGEIISPSFISTSYPVTFPIALSFKLLGESLFNARMVMGFYIILTILLVCILFRGKSKEEILLTLILISTFPPLYGHGKNVLGEVPGLFFVLLSAIFIREIEINKNKLINWILFGLSFGFALSTKPIFILLLPAFGFVLIRMYFEGNISYKNISLLFVSCFVPVILWIHFQFFSSDSWLAVIHYYSNPHSVNIISAAMSNVKDFVSHTRTIFAGGIFALWSITIFYRYYKKEYIHLFEDFLYIFSLLVFTLYFRNPPYYRYFFMAEALSIIFLANNVFILFTSNLYKSIARILFIILVSYQTYGLYFNSWVADSLNSNKTRVMSEVIGNISSAHKVFFYQAPEAVIFLKHFNYYQYFSGTVTTEFGRSSLSELSIQNDLTVITKEELFLKNQDLFRGYKVVQKFDRYVTLKK